MTITEEFLEASREIWDQFYQHPFVKGIEDGTLEKKKFIHYLIQDTLYLIDYGKAFAVGAAKAPDLKTMQFLAEYADNMVNSDSDVNKRYLKRFGIPLEEVYRTELSLDNLSYVSYMLRIAYEGGAAEVLAAVMPCAVSYEDIAKRMIAENPACADDPVYGDFITNYAREAFHDNIQKMIEFVNELSKDYTKEQRKRLVDIFVNCSRYEMKFWDLSWEIK